MHAAKYVFSFDCLRAIVSSVSVSWTNCRENQSFTNLSNKLRVTSGEEVFCPKPLRANVSVLKQTGTNGGLWSRFVIQTRTKGAAAGRGRLCRASDTL
jgi:hypothetical protein